MLKTSLIFAITIGLFSYAFNQDNHSFLETYQPILDTLVPEQHHHDHNHDHHHDHHISSTDHFCGGNEVNTTFYQQNPKLKGLQDQLEDTWAKRVAEGHVFNANRTVYTLPVVVHVIQNNGAGNIPDAQVQAAIQNLNEAFANTGPYNPLTGVATDIQFCLAQQDPSGNVTTGITNTSSVLTVMDKNTQDASLKNLIQWDPLNYINIWVVDEIIGGVAGYAYYPAAHGTAIDGIVIEDDYMSNNSAETSILVHELGHYLGLYHTFDGGCTNNDCTTDGDKVCDTPPDNTTARPACGSPLNSCTTDEDDTSVNNPFRAVALGGLGDQIDQKENYMDYSNLSCYDRFSGGQKDRMHFFLLGIRSSLLSSQVCGVPCTDPINVSPYIAAPSGLITAGTNVSLRNGSSTGTTYNWSINGTTIATTQNTLHFFNTVGTFWAVLEVSNANPSCTKIDSVMVQVYCVPPCSEICDNGIDDDGNGWIDCYDPACACNDCSGKEANTWYFGRGTGLDFNSGTPVAIEGSLNTNNIEACASVSDQNGNILFYTDGKKVWNRMHNQMPSGNIDGHASTAQILILPKPGDPLIYYIFVPDESGASKGLTYNVVDMSLNNNLGDVVQHDVPLSGVKTTEAVTAVKNCNNTDYWVISREFHSNRYHVYDVTTAGINSTPFIQAVGTVHDTVVLGNFANAISNLKVSPDGKRMATSFRHNHMFEVYDFDNSTGIISNPLSMYDFGWGSCYGVEFSPNSKVLYTSTIYPWRLFQFDLTAGTTGTALQATEYRVHTTSTHGGNVELGPDGKIYHTKRPLGSLDIVHSPNNLGASCNYEQNGVSTNFKQTGIGISNNIKNYVVPLATSVTGNTAICSSTGPTTELYGLSDIPCNLDTVLWKHTGSNSMIWIDYINVQFNADYTGTDTIIADFIGPCEHVSDTVIIHSTINPTIDFGPDTTICTNGIYYLEAGAGYESYLWQDGSIDPFFTVFESGTYWVEGTTYCGDVIRDSIVVTLLSNQYISLQDTLIDMGDTAVYSFNPSYTYQWSPNQNIDCANCANPKFYPSTTTMYYVTINNGQGCFAVDSMRIAVNPTSTTSIKSLNSIKVYPNPAQRFVKIESEGAAIDLIRVYDVSGRLIDAKYVAKAEQVELSTDNYPNGLILIEVFGENVLHSEKVLINR